MIAAIASAVSAILIDYLQGIFKSRTAALLALLVLISVLVLLLDEALERVIEKSLAVRKLIAGNEFIEGYWYDMSIDNATKKVVHGVIFSIWFDDGAFKVDGVTFDPEGNRIATFSSTNAAYSNRLLLFEYRGLHDAFAKSIETGVCQIQFDNPPQSYSGFYFDYTGAISFRVHGRKVDKHELDTYKSFHQVDMKRDFMLSVMSARQAALSAHHVPSASQGAQA